MKRLNPATNLPFKKGDVREDGYVFKTYYKKQLKKSGQFSELWAHPDRFYKEFRTLEGKARALYDGAKFRAKKDNLEFNLTLDHIKNLLSFGVCDLTKIPFSYELHEFRQNPRAPSLDKIDSSKGYTIENVRVVLWLVNAALQECSDKEALPILEALVKGLKRNVKKNTITPIPIGDNRKSQNSFPHGAAPSSGPWQDSDNPDDHCGADARQDTDHSTQESSGDSVGRGGKEVVPSETPTCVQDYGITDAEIVRLDIGRGHLFD